jgi:hypothetical protein
MSARYIYDNGDFVIHFSAETRKNDSGVSGSPVWDEIGEITVVFFQVRGTEFDVTTLPKELSGALVGLAEMLEGDEWAIEEDE